MQTLQNVGEWRMFSTKQPITVINQLTQIGKLCALSTALRAAQTEHSRFCARLESVSQKGVKVATSASIFGEDINHANSTTFPLTLLLSTTPISCFDWRLT